MGWYETAKDIASIATKIDNVDLIKKVMQLQQEGWDQQEELLLARQRVRELEQQLALRDELKPDPHGSFYWRVQTDGRTGPYCTACADARGQTIRLHRRERAGDFWCPECKVAVPDPSSAKQRSRRRLFPDIPIA